MLLLRNCRKPCKKWLTFDVETLNNLYEKRCITSLMSHIKVDIAVLFGQEIVH